ncbi:PLP-dependent transferase [Undibacterium arcticum]
MGAIAGPFDSFSGIARNKKTLALRVERHCTSALDLARWLEAQPKVARVFSGLGVASAAHAGA